MAAPKKVLLTADEIKKLASLAGLGLTVENMARVMDISKATLDRRMNDQPGVAEAIEKGRASASAAVRNTAFKMATSGKCPAMTIFWLKCRERWREENFETYEVADSLK